MPASARTDIWLLRSPHHRDRCPLTSSSRSWRREGFRWLLVRDFRVAYLARWRQQWRPWETTLTSWSVLVLGSWPALGLENKIHALKKIIIMICKNVIIKNHRRYIRNKDTKISEQSVCGNSLIWCGVCPASTLPKERVDLWRSAFSLEEMHGGSVTLECTEEQIFFSSFFCSFLFIFPFGCMLLLLLAVIFMIRSPLLWLLSRPVWSIMMNRSNGNYY